MKFEETTVSKEYVFKGKILNLRRDKITLPDGKPAEREVVEHSGGSAVLCERDDKIFLVKQFRYPYKQVLLELPAGKLNAGENPELTAIRELLEEGGIIAERVELMFTVYPTPGYTDEKIYIYKAHGLKDGVAKPDDGEFVSGAWYDKKELKTMINDGTIKDGKTLIALLSVLK